METQRIADFLRDKKYFEVACALIINFMGPNAESFEQNDIERRVRILEFDVRDWINQFPADTDMNHIAAIIIEKAESALQIIISPEEMAIEEIQPEDEDQESGVPVYKIASYPSDPTLEVLKLMNDRNEIVVPKFQRGWIWSPVQASKLIESFLLGLPVPGIFLYKEDSGKYLVIEGQQRLKTVFGFFNGILPDGGRFFLRGVDPKWNGLTYEQLEERDKIKFRNSILRVVNVEQQEPDDTTSIYHIFERLNTGGTGLTPQEVRNCVYHGPFNDMLYEINKLAAWRHIFGLTNPDTRMRDIEIIVRFFALSECKYVRPMKGFLSDFMGKHKREKDLDRYQKIFTDTIERIHKDLGPKPFHIRRGINVAVFDSVSVAFSRNPTSPLDIKERYSQLLENPGYQECISSSITDTDTVNHRIALAQEVLFH